MEIYKHVFIDGGHFITENKIELFIGNRKLRVNSLNINDYFLIKNDIEYNIIFNKCVKYLQSPIYVNLNNINNINLSIVFE